MRLIITIICLLLIPVEVFALNNWQQKASFGGPARHRATAFSIGQKGYIGMGHINSAEHIIYKDIWEYDPATNSWTQKADFGGGLRYQCAAFTINGIAYMGTGRNEFDVYETDFWKFDPNANTWYPVEDFPGEERRGASAFAINGKGYVGLGQATSGYANDFWEYDPEADEWHQMADFIGLPRTSAVSFVYNGKAYVGTGHTYSAALNDFYEFTPSSNTWIQKSNVGDALRQDATGFQINGKGYIGTGNNVDGSINYKDFWCYNFETDTWQQIENFTGSARRYMVSFTIDNIAYCGTGTNGTNFKDFWSYNPLLNLDKSQYKPHTISVYPNPSSQIINMSFNNETVKHVKIYSLDGQLIKNFSNINESNVILSKSDFGSGIFLFQVNVNNQIQTGKFTFI